MHEFLLIASLYMSCRFLRTHNSGSFCNFGGNPELLPDSHTTRAAFWVKIGCDEIHTGVQHTHQWLQNWFEDAEGLPDFGGNALKAGTPSLTLSNINAFMTPDAP